MIAIKKEVSKAVKKSKRQKAIINELKATREELQAIRGCLESLKEIKTSVYTLDARSKMAYGILDKMKGIMEGRLEKPSGSSIPFTKQSMEETGMIKYAGQGKTKIEIIYDADSGDGWLTRLYGEGPIPFPYGFVKLVDHL